MDLNVIKCKRNLHYFLWKPALANSECIALRALNITQQNQNYHFPLHPVWHSPLKRWQFEFWRWRHKTLFHEISLIPPWSTGGHEWRQTTSLLEVFVLPWSLPLTFRWRYSSASSCPWRWWRAKFWLFNKANMMFLLSPFCCYGLL